MYDNVSAETKVAASTDSNWYKMGKDVLVSCWHKAVVGNYLEK
jgi:hypothetical protein